MADKTIEEKQIDEINKLNDQLNEKLIENDNYKQELHNLRHKLKACLETQKDLTIANEIIEEKLNSQETLIEKKTNQLTEKFSAEKKKYEEKINELEAKLMNEEKKNEELKETIILKEKLFNILRNEEPDKIQENLLLKEKIDCLKDDIENRDKIHWEFISKQQHLEEAHKILQKDYDEIRDILEVKKEHLASMNKILETTRDELLVCRSELESLKSVPASDSIKGNSLFAEVEDNRRKLINDMTSLKKKYLYMKENYDVREREIRALRAENAALLLKLQDETIGTVDQSGRLIETYKSRIWELENRIKIEEKKLKMKENNKEQQKAGISFSYLQSVLEGKKKEIEELCNKLEESSIQKILHEEMRFENEKQIRKWRYKAMSYQAQLLAVENQAKCDECLKMKSNESGDSVLSIKIEQQPLDCQSTECSTNNLGLNRADSTLEEVLIIPKVQTKETIDLTDNSIVEDSDKFENSKRIVRLEESIDMEETMPVAKCLWEEKSIANNKSDKENNASISNVNETILKSALVKSTDNNSQEKSKKSLRFTSDTEYSEKPKPIRQKIEKKSYPIVFISSNKPEK